MMREEITRLLQKYFEAETTLEEEHILRAFFRQEELPEEMKPYKAWFENFGKENFPEEDASLENEMMDAILMKERRKTKRILWLSLSGIAASLLIALGATFYSRQEPHFRDTFTNPDMAMAYANETLLFVSSKYTEGLEQLEPIQKLGHATLPLKKGLRRVNSGLSEIDKVYLINKIF